MSLQARLIGAGERDRFNAFVEGHPKGEILQSYEWGEVKAATGWRAYRLVVEDAEGTIRGAASILERELPVLRRPILYAPRGPVLDFRDKAVWEALMQGIKQLGRERGAILFKIDPDVVEDGTITPLLTELGFRRHSRGPNFEGLQPRFVYRLSIDRDLDEILAGFHQKTRYNIRLAERKGVIVKDDCAKADLPHFYRLLRETAARDKFLIRGPEYYDIIWEHLVERGYARLFMAYYQGQPIAGTLAFTLGDKVWYVYGASGNEHRNVMPNYLLQWKMICWAKSLGCKLYDFRGVSGDMNPDNPLYGLYRFKKGFNGELVEFVGEFDYPFAVTAYRLWNWGEPRYREWRSRLARAKELLSGAGGAKR